MMLALPTWRDCLHFSGGGKIEEMRKAEVLSARDFEARHPDANANRLILSKALGLAPMVTPVDSLHRIVSDGTKVKVIATIDGSAYEGLFGNVNADACLSWKQ